MDVSAIPQFWQQGVTRAFSLTGSIETQNLDVLGIFMGLFGGLALFLFGMDKMSESLKLVAGNGMKTVLAKLTTNRFTGALAGAIVTAIIQSSSVTTVLVIGFISAQLMTLSQSIGVIMGANVGTTITAQIIAFQVTKYALLMVGLGFAMNLLSRHEKVRHYGDMILGLGLIFFGMQLMSEGASPLRSYQPFIETMKQMDRPLYGILLGTAFTAIVQSSSATTGIVIVLASQGFISLEAGIALIFGANVGTCVTALLAAIGKPREAVRAAVVHVIFNIGGVLLWFYFIPQLAAFVTQISPPHSQAMQGIGNMAANTPRQIANAHTLFNIANTLIFIWFTGPLASLVCWLVPERIDKAGRTAEPKYLNTLLLETPSLAMDLVRMELGRMGAAAVYMVRGCLPAILDGNSQDLDRLEQMDDDVDKLHAAIVTYLGQLSKENLANTQSVQLHDYLSAANYLESIADLVESNLSSAGRQRIAHGLSIGPRTRKLLTEYHKLVSENTMLAVQALVENNAQRAQQVLDEKQHVNDFATKLENHLTQRLAANEPNRLQTFRLETEMIDYLKRVFYFSKRIAKLVLEHDMRQMVESHSEKATRKRVADEQRQEAKIC